MTIYKRCSNLYIITTTKRKAKARVEGGREFNDSILRGNIIIIKRLIVVFTNNK